MSSEPVFTLILLGAGSLLHVLVEHMAGAVVVSGKPGKRYNAKVTPYVWFLCLIGGSGGLLLGYDNGIIGKLRGAAAGAVVGHVHVHAACRQLHDSV